MKMTQHTLNVEYTLHSNDKVEYLNDTLTVDGNTKPSQVERHIQKRWAIVRPGASVKVRDLVVVRMSTFEPVEYPHDDKYHVHYSA